jgi:hypothetical protein
MNDFNIDSLGIMLFLFCPGMIAVYFRSRIFNYRTKGFNSDLFNYFVLSILYLSTIYPLDLIKYIYLNEKFNYIYFLIIIFIGPMIFGLIIGVILKKDLLGYIVKKFSTFESMQKFGLNNLIHPIEDSWEYVFHNIYDPFIIITLKNDTKFYGKFNTGSFASSRPGVCDIYISDIYQIDENEKWSDHPDRSLLVCSNEIISIEILKPDEQGVENG